MTEDQFNSKLIGELHDLNSYLKTIASVLTRMEKILNRTTSIPTNHEVSVKEDDADVE